MNTSKLIICTLLLTFLGWGFSSMVAPPPPQSVQPFFNGIFPKTTPGAQGAWEVYDFMPTNQIPSPLKMIEIPGEPNNVLVISKIGEVWKMNLQTLEQELILDIKDRCLKLGDSGIYGIAIHPRFLEGAPYNYIYLYYRYHPFDTDNWDKEGFNRLSKFPWVSTDQIIDKDSEEVLFHQYDRSNWHSGGAIFFDNDGFLYLGVGDEGLWDEEDLLSSVQKLDVGMFSGLLRIDVDNDPTRSHPIIRQPQPVDTVPEDWGDTYSQGYMIPNDNPWLSPDGSNMEEFYAIGIRSPYTGYYDPLEDQIWIGDVGSDIEEEIILVEREDNHQWPYREGFQDNPGRSKPVDLIGTDKEPFFSYKRDIGSSVILGGVYRGLKFPSLDEKLVFADYSSSKILTLDRETKTLDILVDGINQFGIDLPEEYGIVGVNLMSDGLILLTVLSRDFWEPGKILALRNKEVIPDPPSKLSDLGIFENMDTREPTGAFIPYKVNAPLWSDRALKKRYMAIPNDGTFDSPSEKIGFKEDGSWNFPPGTVFLKHFDLPLSLSDPTSIIPLETRFLIIGEDGVPYGLTYKWDENGEEAYLQSSKTTQSYDIEDNGSFAFQQTWDYPSRSNCMTCHNAAAGYVLGVKTHQLNGELEYPDLGLQVNQLTYLSDQGILDQIIHNPDNLPKSYGLHEQDIPLENRIRSYLDANCATCHRKGGNAQDSEMDLRYEQPLFDQNIIDYPTKSRASKNPLIVSPGDYEHSELWVRDQSLKENRMPPLASNLVDQHYVDSLAKWIGSFKYILPEGEDIFITPSFSPRQYIVNAGDNWLPEFDIIIYDMAGRLVKSEQSNISRYVLDVSGLASGIYVVYCKSSDLKSYNKIQVF